MENPPNELLDALQLARRPYIVVHVTPDADAIGGALALAAVLGANGARPVVSLATDRVATKLRFMFDWLPGVNQATGWSGDAGHDAIIALDTASPQRINAQPAPPFNGDLPTLNIDHHLTNTRFARHNWVDSRATSTCELIARLIRWQGWPLTPPVASLLYAGLYGDTIGFSLASTTAGALQVAAELVRAGAEPGVIGQRLSRSQAREDFELLRRVYDHTVLTPDGLIAYSHVSYADITETGCNAEDIDDQVGVPRSLTGIRIALFFSEGTPGVVRVNLRGEGDTSVIEIAQRLGGGGHRQSAGIRFTGLTIPQVTERVLAVAQEHLRQTSK